MGGIVIYRTTEEKAKAPGGPVKFDLILDTVVKVSRQIPNPEQTRHVKYRLTLDGADPAEIIPNDRARPSSPDAGRARPPSLGQERPARRTAHPRRRRPTREYLRPNALVTSEDIRVRSLAATRDPATSSTPGRRPCGSTTGSTRTSGPKNFKVAFASANAVARNLSGDCTEHAVLAAAMHRAVGIPSRVVVGLIYVDELEGFGYHMWNEVFVNHRWVAIDPSWDQSTVDAVHIKLSDTEPGRRRPVRGVPPRGPGDGPAGHRADRVALSRRRPAIASRPRREPGSRPEEIRCMGGEEASLVGPSAPP